MFERREFALLGMSAAALAVMQAAGFAKEDEKDDDMDECAEACSDCQRACDVCTTHCITMLGSGHNENAATLQACLDCASICAAASQIVSRSGPYSDLVCKACAEACAKCAKECEKFPKHEIMKDCAKECRECEKACNAMVHKKAVAQSSSR